MHHQRYRRRPSAGAILFAVTWAAAWAIAGAQAAIALGLGR